MKKIKIVGLCIGILVFIFVLVAYVQGIITATHCENYCENKSAIAYQRFHSGELDLKDPCVCYYHDRIETIILE